MSLIKHGQRTVRKGCSKCGSKELYWAHDSESSKTSAHYCNEHSSANWTLINRDGSKHDCTGSNGINDQPEQSETETGKDDIHVITAMPEAKPTAPVTAPAANDAKFAQLASLLGELTTATVDVAQVHSIVDERLRGLILPLQLEIKRDGVVRKVEGLAHKSLPVIIKRLVRKHVLMVGPAGTGKSHIAHQAADALGLEFYSISLTPQTPASAITGYMTATGDYIATAFRNAFEHGGLFLFDEVDNGHPSTLGIINSALANGSMAFPDGMVKRHADFRCAASANTYGRGPDRAYVGRQALDAAFMDRFTVITVDVDEALEESLCLATRLDATRVKSCLAHVRHLRAKAIEYKLPLVFSPRRSESLCDALADGFTVAEASEMEVRRGISDTDWRKVADGAPRI